MPLTRPTGSICLRRLLAISSLTSLIVISPALVAKDATLPEPMTTIQGPATAVQWTAESVTVLETADIDATYAYSLQDLAGYAPGLLVDPISTSNQGAYISSRGIDTSSGGDPAVAVMIDGIYVGDQVGQNPMLFDFERVEIARGPQGTYQGGAAAIGGSINLQRSKPTGVWSVKSRASAGERYLQAVDTVVNFPVGNNTGLAGKLGVSWTKGRREELKNTFSGRDENRRQRYSLTAALLWNATDNLSIQYNFDAERDGSVTPGLLNFSTGTDWVCSTNNNLSCVNPLAPGRPETGTIKATSQNFSNDRDYTGDHHSLHTNLDLGQHQISNITAWRRNKENIEQDRDATFGDYHSTREDLVTDQFSEELKVNSRWADDLTSVAGLYLQSRDSTLARVNPYIYDTLAAANSIPGLSSAGQQQQVNSHLTDVQTTLFGHLNYALNSQWDTDIGLRWQANDKRLGYTASVPGSTIPASAGVESNDRSLSANAGISYRVDDQAMIYARYARTRMPGGFDYSANTKTAATNGYGEQATQSYELGMKSEWFDDNLRLNLALFSNRQQNKLERADQRDSTGAIDQVLSNRSQVDVHGYEVELEATPLANLYLRGAYARMSPDYTDYPVPDLADITKTIDLSGLTPNRAPAHNLFLSARYGLVIPMGVIDLFASYHYVTDNQNNPLLALGRIDHQSQWDISATYQLQDWRLRVFMQNVNDNNYIRNATNVTDSSLVSLAGNLTPQGIVTYTDYNQPRFAGLEVVYTPVF